MTIVTKPKQAATMHTAPASDLASRLVHIGANPVNAALGDVPIEKKIATRITDCLLMKNSQGIKQWIYFHDISVVVNHETLEYLGRNSWEMANELFHLKTKSGSVSIPFEKLSWR